LPRPNQRGIDTGPDYPFTLNAARLAHTAIGEGHGLDATTAMYRGGPDRCGVYGLGAARPSGRAPWVFNAGGTVSSPAVAGGRVFVGGLYDVYALDAVSGQLRWKFEISGGVKSSPAVAGGMVFIGSGQVDNHVYALDAVSGQLRWKFETGGGVWGSPAVAGGIKFLGIGEERWGVFVGSGDGDNHVYALDAASGHLWWKAEAGGRDRDGRSRGVESSPAVAGGGVFAGSNDGHVYALDAASGHLWWKASLSFRDKLILVC
jgi:outer membrane protein assembly factor BamB